MSDDAYCNTGEQYHNVSWYDLLYFVSMLGVNTMVTRQVDDISLVGIQHVAWNAFAQMDRCYTADCNPSLNAWEYCGLKF